MRKFIMLFCVGVFQAADANMDQYIEFPASACDTLTYVNINNPNDTGMIEPDNGYYTIEDTYDFDDRNMSDATIRSFICTTSTGSQSFEITSIYGHYEYAASEEAEVWFAVDGTAQPCTLWQPAYKGALINSAAGDASTCLQSGYSNDMAHYTVTQPIPISGDWNSISYTLAEYTYPGGSINHAYKMPMTITHKIVSPTPPSPDLNSIKLSILGNNDTNHNSFNLFNEKGNWVNQVASSSSSNNWYRVATANNVSTLDPLEFDIGMSKESINELKNANYSCNLTMTPSHSSDPSITNTLNDLMFSNTAYPEYLFFENAASSLIYTPAKDGTVTFTLNAKCTNNNGEPEIDFNPQTITLYRTQHF